MNRLDLVFPSPDQPAPADSFDLSWSLSEAITSTAVATPTATAELITIRVKPGASIRRLRNHRCSWPRRF